ncbi:Alg9-like mannosyltransferase family-domain-containing protein [Aspergillus ambiguus]|uniref:putative glycosylphosphatidylinositol-alpha 1,2 mannosyltransferase n=1 Tax=Aspergillus ambiguus TaxID=176160 RepID=UPI003CCE537A
MSTSPLLLLLALRLLNALSLHTFFQPDEFFQSLEPAYQLAFGDNQGAWITWEWRHHLRSSLHPLLFSGVYAVADLLARLLHLSSAVRADLLVAAPKTTQALIAAIADFYTWKLARRVYGRNSHEATAVLALTVLSPWQWFCSTRTLSNCLETSITVVALYLWPWDWSDAQTDRRLIVQLRQCLALAALACIFRPTNTLIWMTLASVAWMQNGWSERKTLCREVFLCGSSVLAISTLADRLYYGVWTFPPLKFLYFNIAQSLAVFYGRNDWHYYLSQGYPLLLTTALPFTLVGLYRVVARPASAGPVQRQLATICLFMPLVLSLISHKEVRFIYPLLPALHVLTAPPLVDFFLPAVSRSTGAYTPRRLTLAFLVLINLAIAGYTSIYHNSGIIDVLSYLRHQHEAHDPVSRPAGSLHHPYASDTSQPGITAGFLMPCHSTPWRSHMVHPTLYAWALTCDPPVGLNATEKALYVDEADQFYADPAQFLREHMSGGLRHIPRSPSYTLPPGAYDSSLLPLPHDSPAAYQQATPHDWPDYLVFFAQLEPTLQSLLRASSYAECWRTFNTPIHDDWRRRGDVVVWCLDPAEQAAWRSQQRQRALEQRDRQFDRIIQEFRNEARRQQRALPRSSPSPWTRWTSGLFSRPPAWSWPWERRSRLQLRFPWSRPSPSKWPSWDWLPWKKSAEARYRELWA